MLLLHLCISLAVVGISFAQRRPLKCPAKPCGRSRCTPTCAVPNPKNCSSNPSTEPKACQCTEGYILSEKGGKCIKIEECPQNLGCNGDLNATIKKCPWPCPSTCSSPDAKPCPRMCLAVGCECNPGYILSKPGGVCIKPDKCPGGDPCGANATFAYCKASCPSDYCPVNDDRGIIACDPPYPCPSGCICKLNYRRKSVENETCIISTECPPVECTRPNEHWESCPSACLAENCEDYNGANQPSTRTCNPLVYNCQPQCICNKKYFRNREDICIPANDCHLVPPTCGINEVPTNCEVTCPPQICGIGDRAGACPPGTPCKPGCNCYPNHLRNANGICVPVEECPTTKNT